MKVGNGGGAWSSGTCACYSGFTAAVNAGQMVAFHAKTSDPFHTGRIPSVSSRRRNIRFHRGLPEACPKSLDVDMFEESCCL